LPKGSVSRFRVNEPVLDEGTLYTARDAVHTSDEDTPPRIEAYGSDDKRLWYLPTDGTGDLIKAGNRLYAGGAQAIVAIDLPNGEADAKVAWSTRVEGTVLRLIAASDRLFAVTLDGRIWAFGEESGEPKTLAQEPKPVQPAAAVAERAERILAATGQRDGYALWFGVDDSDLLQSVAAASQLHIVAVDSDAKKVDRLRRRLEAGWKK